ncbi:hydroxymethylpyrimidine/phosphomethylpyrimidine kinase [Myroides gitamensis]|uniref:hydroxymethylpyrimidine/phosphomethylpyrimidine kinase n=1 Tax=Myroides odoratus TaxID=256 RepID=UPI00216719B7|nr:hydroxymethylpyrimidine/phosphomethylpyrimidine kinase [Myroides odoratus]MCS4239909.1 hydroxymethylpyrimidine/phosphomethylpyrimidine kinase [Myroides odoratus]MDH6602595.1 hydroxymethylpyrimidine/phosphomethylpyrimidine kinase [Myroides gitamensis]
MLQTRPIALSIAGFDPSGGAGLLADIKTFESHQVYGLGILTANTIQTEDEFVAIRWEKRAYILQQLEVILQRYQPQVVKIGIVESGEELLHYLQVIKQHIPQAYIIWDPVLRSSTHFDFTTGIEGQTLEAILLHLDLITPNYFELDQLIPIGATPLEKAQSLSAICAVLLKGGHHPETKAVDYLLTADEQYSFYPQQVYPSTKHGTGCILSSAIASQLALGDSLYEAVQKSKQYVEKILASNSTLLAYHV